MANSKRKIITTTVVNNYTPIHPALDFTEDTAIVSVGIQLRHDYENNDIEFKDGELTVLSDGDYFIYSRKALAEKGYYYSRSLDLPIGRWEYDDLIRFCEETKFEGVDIDLISTYTTIKERIDFFMDFENPVYLDLLSCFIIYTYFYPLFASAPILQLWGDIKTGKTKTASLISALCFNPIDSANISESCVFRAIEGQRAVVLLDESEDLATSERGKAICNLLLAGYNKSGKTYRQEKLFDGAYKTVSFKVFGPKVIANVTGISMPALQSRVIRLILTGAADKNKTNRDVDLEDPIFAKIRNKLYRIAMTQHRAIFRAREELQNTTLNDRTLGIWQGILTIASLIDKTILDNLVSYAITNMADIQEELDMNDSGTAVLKRLYLFVEEKGNGEYKIGDLYKFIHQDENLLDITLRGLSITMKRLGFNNKLKRFEKTVARYYNLTSEKLLARISRH